MRSFVDTSIIRHAVRMEYGEETRTVQWGGSTHEWQSSVLVPKPQRDSWLETQIEAIRLVAAAARRGDVHLVVSPETDLEAMDFPRPLLVRSSASLLYGITFERAVPPFYLNRLLVTPRELEVRGWDPLQQALDLAPDERYRAIRAAIGPEKAMDAYHLRCAEHAGCEYFLTTDKRLVNSAKNQSRLELQLHLVFPSELAAIARRDV